MYQDYRPISFKNGMIKILSKVLFISLHSKIEELILDCQTTFVQGHVIFEGFVAAAEIVSFCPCSWSPSILCKIDFEKILDYVSWDFLFDLLHQRRFDKKWIDWMPLLFISSTSMLVINNSIGSSYLNKRGLKQGNKLSPLLFILIMDTLTRILKIINLERLLEGIRTCSISLDTFRVFTSLIIH